MKYTPGCDLVKFVKEMTLDQKIRLEATLTDISSDPLPELGLKEMCIADGATGVSFLQIFLDRAQRIVREAAETGVYPPDIDDARHSDNILDEVLGDCEKVYRTADHESVKYKIAKYLHDIKPNGQEPTCFPSGVVFGSMWNPEKVYECAKHVGEEMDAFGVDVVLGPNVDVQRDPLGGRAYECYSEDPYLIEKTAAAYINGLQSVGIAACAKHFAVHNQETNRHSIDCYISERAMREVYLKGFEAAVRDANVKSIMMSYNKINGVHCAESTRLMKDILRDDWGFEGCVVSDWGAANDEPKSISAGLDLVLPTRRADIKQAIADGKMTEDDLDRACLRILQMYETLNGMKGRDKTQYNDAASMQSVYDCTVDGAILLKNEGVLPAEIGTPTAFWGKRTHKLIECGGGSTQVFTEKTSSVLKRARLVNGENDCTFEELSPETKLLVYTVAYPGHESADNPSLLIEHDDRVKIKGILKTAKESGIKTVVVLNTAGPVDMRDWIEYADAVLCVYIPGCEGGNAIADMIYGVSAPAGRLAQTFPVRYEDTPSSLNFPGCDNVEIYGEDIFVGYRYYDKKNITPAYPFGFGLSYTSFEMSCAETALEMDENGTVDVRVKVKNTGKRAGAEVVQVYVHQEHPYYIRPERELKGFKKVYLEAGEEKEVVITLDRSSLAYYEPERADWVVEGGAYKVYVGRSSRDFAAVIDLKVSAGRPFGMNEKTTINEIAENERAVEIMTEIVPDFRERLAELLEDFDGETILDVYDFIMPQYYINPIYSMRLFRGACAKLAEIK